MYNNYERGIEKLFNECVLFDPESMILVKSITRDDFKKDLSMFERFGVIAFITEYFNKFTNEFNITHGKKETTIIKTLGLPETSDYFYSFDCTCNCSLKNEQGYRLNYFAVTINNILIACFNDDNGNDYFYRMN